MLQRKEYGMYVEVEETRAVKFTIEMPYEDWIKLPLARYIRSEYKNLGQEQKTLLADFVEAMEAGYEKYRN